MISYSTHNMGLGQGMAHATIDFIKDIEDTIEKNEYAVGVFCDLSKAFDTLNHNILLAKLEHYGIRGTALQWFTSYLHDRKQFKEWHGQKSPLAHIETGVPQGSILGPLLFLIYINDLPSATKLKSVIYADDTNLLIKGQNLTTLIRELNDELQNVSDFFRANQLKLNAKKTKVVCFQKKKTTQTESLNVLLDSERLEIENEARFLGQLTLILIGTNTVAM